MGEQLIHHPGHANGPCPGPCTHLGCQQLREMASQNCEVCGTPIGYECNFYEIANGSYAHALCYELKASGIPVVLCEVCKRPMGDYFVQSHMQMFHPRRA